MTIHLSKELEQFVRDAVRAGHYAREGDVIRDALTRLKQTMPAQKAERAEPKKTPLTPDELNRRLLVSGRIVQLPDPAKDVDDDGPDDLPVLIEGEPLSETILRERR
jgi:Arc/MetJ-type ribon-helix-helix transcriptional regulator